MKGFEYHYIAALLWLVLWNVAETEGARIIALIIALAHLGRGLFSETTRE